MKHLEEEIAQENVFWRKALDTVKEEDDKWLGSIDAGETVTRPGHVKMVEEAVEHTLSNNLSKYVSVVEHQKEVERLQDLAKEAKKRIMKDKERIAQHYVPLDEHAAKLVAAKDAVQRWIQAAHEAAQVSIDSESAHLDTMMQCLSDGKISTTLTLTRGKNVRDTDTTGDTNAKQTRNTTSP